MQAQEKWVNISKGKHAANLAAKQAALGEQSPMAFVLVATTAQATKVPRKGTDIG